jgi:DNA-binding response OmpR family regulator
VSKLTILLITHDPSVGAELRTAIEPVATGRVEVVTDWDKACVRIQSADVGMLLVHSGSSASVSQLLRAIMESGRRVPVVVLSDRFIAGQAIEVLAMGAVDYLTRPFDLERLGFLVERLTARACPMPRVVATPAVRDAADERRRAGQALLANKLQKYGLLGAA